MEHLNKICSVRAEINFFVLGTVDKEKTLFEGDQIRITDITVTGYNTRVIFVIENVFQKPWKSEMSFPATVERYSRKSGDMGYIDICNESRNEIPLRFLDWTFEVIKNSK